MPNTTTDGTLGTTTQLATYASTTVPTLVTATAINFNFDFDAARCSGGSGNGGAAGGGLFMVLLRDWRGVSVGQGVVVRTYNTPTIQQVTPNSTKAIGGQEITLTGASMFAGAPPTQLTDMARDTRQATLTQAAL